ncbi:glutamine-hydrolyzing GMP synthase [Candidatus Micrarchaeota archaeon]|nr:glutamine-hydrolyzing GMP synthase [Candidatus Micrarchaeota archaeon]
MILIIDNGSQYTHLIKRNCRDQGYEAEMLYAKAAYGLFHEQLKSGISKLILSGGPSSVYKEPPNLGNRVLGMFKNEELRMPLLGICYGHQMIAHAWGGIVKQGKSAEYGMGEVVIDREDLIFRGVPRKLKVWVSHFDEVQKEPEEFERLAHSDICAVEAMRHRERPIFSVQFHPEVWHTEHGEEILRNFLEIETQEL